MSYSISGIKINNFKLQNLNEYVSIIESEANIQGYDRISNLVDIFLIQYVSSFSSDKELNLSNFFDFYNDYLENDLCFKSDKGNIKDIFIQFMNNNILKDDVHFYFLPNKNYSLVKINNTGLREALVNGFDSIEEYSFSTSSGYSSYDEAIDKGDIKESKEVMYDKVSDDWADFTKDSFYILEHAFSRMVFNYGSIFKDNYDVFVTNETLKSRLSKLSSCFIYRHYKDVFIEETMEDAKKQFNDTKSFLKWRKEFMNDSDFNEKLLSSFHSKIHPLDEKTIKNVFDEDHKHNSMF